MASTSIPESALWVLAASVSTPSIVPLLAAAAAEAARSRDAHASARASPQRNLSARTRAVPRASAPACLSGRAGHGNGSTLIDWLQGRGESASPQQLNLASPPGQGAISAARSARRALRSWRAQHRRRGVDSQISQSDQRRVVPRAERLLERPAMALEALLRVGHGDPRETMKAQSLACSASSSRTAPAPARSPAASSRALPSASAKAISATAGADQVDRSPSSPQLLADQSPGVSGAGHLGGLVAFAARRRGGSARGLWRAHSSTTASSQATPSYHQCPSSSVSSAHTTRPPPAGCSAPRDPRRSRVRATKSAACSRASASARRARRRSPSLLQGLWWWTVWWW